jgi:hypothetical protein
MLLRTTVQCCFHGTVGTSPQEQVPSGSSEVDAADEEPLALIRINHEEPLAPNRINEEPLPLRRLDQEPWALSLLVALGRTITLAL